MSPMICLSGSHARLQGIDGRLRVRCLAELAAGLQRVFHRLLGGRQVQRHHLLDALHGLGGQGIESLHLQIEQGLGGVCELLGVVEHRFLLG